MNQLLLSLVLCAFALTLSEVSGEACELDVPILKSVFANCKLKDAAWQKTGDDCCKKGGDLMKVAMCINKHKGKALANMLPPGINKKNLQLFCDNMQTKKAGANKDICKCIIGCCDKSPGDLKASYQCMLDTGCFAKMRDECKQ
jgi:hypothetical protein